MEEELEELDFYPMVLLGMLSPFSPPAVSSSKRNAIEGCSVHRRIS